MQQVANQNFAWRCDCVFGRAGGRDEAPIWIEGLPSVWFMLRMEEKRRQAAALPKRAAPR
jgi:hypothetical protein